jgi:hypothetical protein
VKVELTSSSPKNKWKIGAVLAVTETSSCSEARVHLPDAPTKIRGPQIATLPSINRSQECARLMLMA